jgi:hypothetical protein
MRILSSAFVVVFLSGALVGFGTSRLASTRSPPPAVGAARYVESMRAWDGHAVWESYSRDYQDLLAQEGGGEAETVRLYDELRQQGASIDEVSYIGGYQTIHGGYFLYVTRHFVKGEEASEVVWVFRTDEDGLIDGIN